MILACKDIKKSYGIDTILEKITFNIENNEKVAIVGVNGAGKTTLFKIIVGEISQDSGDLFIKKDTKYGYMKQNALIDSEKTIYEEAISVFSDIIELEKNLREMEKEMSNLEGEKLEAFMHQYSLLQHKFEDQNGYGYKSYVKGVLKGLGFKEEEFENSLSQLSGGEKTRVYLSKLLLSKPDLLLLDEPTNHLDMDSISWLEDFLRAYEGAVVIISHDRYFMDKVATKTIEIENKKSSTYEGNYTFYTNKKEMIREIQQKQFLDNQKEIKRQEEVIKTLRSFNREKSIKRAESREKALEKAERIEKPDNLPEKMRLNLTPKIISGNDVIFAENLEKSFPDKRLFENVNIDIKRGGKVALIGPNGVGKSTLFKILLGKEKPNSGIFKLGMNVNIGYYDQEHESLNENKTIIQEISDEYPTLTNGEIRNFLAAFVFEGDDVFKEISSLSGGEKGRVMLAKIMLGKSNCLFLDEPTNHLDMFSKEVLENALNRYEGTVIYISHDRYFVNKTAETILELTPNGINKYLGNYDYYLEKKVKQEKEQELFGEKIKIVEEASSETKNNWQSQKDKQAKERKIKNKILKIEKEIEELEEKIEELEQQLNNQTIATNAEKVREIFEEKTELENRVGTLMEQWEEASSETI